MKMLSSACLAVALLALCGCEKEDAEPRPDTRSSSRAEIEANHRASEDRRIVINHAMYVGEIPLDEPVVAHASKKAAKPDARPLGKAFKNSGIESASATRNVPAPPPAAEYLR